MGEPAGRRRPVIAAVLDTVCIVVFTAAGRRTHDSSGAAVAATLEVAAPFLVGAAVGWVAGRVWRNPFGWAAGVAVWLGTVVVGMVLRHVAFGRGTALPFVIVATTFTMCALLGWRAAGRWLVGRRRPTPSDHWP